MIDNYNFISIKEVINRATRHPLLQDLTMEDAIYYTLDFINAIGLPNIYEENISVVPIEKYRGLLPCNLVSIIQVKNKQGGILRSMTDSFNSLNSLPSEQTFKTQGNVITTSFEKGVVLISYKGLKVDEEELPMIPDNPLFLRALEAYIKKERFSILVDLGRMHPSVYQKTEQDYYWLAGQCRGEFLTPSISEMQTITGMLGRMIPSKREFHAGFKGLGDTQYYKTHK